MDITAQIAAIGVVPVLRLDHPERDAAPLAHALCRGGVPVAEVTFRAPGAADAMARMREAAPELLVGAGTVLTTAQIDEALDAGAQFLVSPGLDPALVRYSQARGVPLFPGCTTATEYHTAYGLGLTTLKFFPAEPSGGVEKLAALAAPFPMFRILPTGGITLDNLARYLACPAVCACGGSFMAPPRLLEAGQWNEITALCRRAREIADTVR